MLVNKVLTLRLLLCAFARFNMWFVLLEMLVEVVSKTPYNFYKNAIIFFLLNEIFFVENFIDEYLFYDRSLGRKLH